MIKDEAVARAHVVSIVMASRGRRSWSSMATQAGMGKPRFQRLWWQYREHMLTADRRTIDTPAYHYHYERFTEHGPGEGVRGVNLAWRPLDPLPSPVRVTDPRRE